MRVQKERPREEPVELEGVLVEERSWNSQRPLNQTARDVGIEVVPVFPFPVFPLKLSKERTKPRMVAERPVQRRKKEQRKRLGTKQRKGFVWKRIWTRVRWPQRLLASDWKLQVKERWRCGVFQGSVVGPLAVFGEALQC